MPNRMCEGDPDCSNPGTYEAQLIFDDGVLSYCRECYVIASRGSARLDQNSAYYDEHGYQPIEESLALLDRAIAREEMWLARDDEFTAFMVPKERKLQNKAKAAIIQWLMDYGPRRPQTG